MDRGDVAFFMHPTVFWNQVQALDKFSLAINSPVQDPVARMPKAFLYGLPVYTSNLIPNASGQSGRRNLLAHRDAIHWATSPVGTGGSAGAAVGANGIRLQTNYFAPQLATISTADMLYGVVKNRDNAGVQILTS